MKQKKENPTRKRPNIVEYMEDGYKVTEVTYSDPYAYMVTKEKNGKVEYYYRTKTGVTKGVYDKAEFDKKMADFDRQMDEWNEKWNKSLEEWGDEVDKRFKNSFGTIPTIPQIPKMPKLPSPPALSDTTEAELTSDFFEPLDFDDLFDDDLFDSKTTRNSSTQQTEKSPYHSSYYSNKPRRVYYEKKTSGGGCLGCLVWSILLLCIVCIILYGMGVIGGNIINFILNLFR